MTEGMTDLLGMSSRSRNRVRGRRSGLQHGPASRARPMAEQLPKRIVMRFARKRSAVTSDRFWWVVRKAAFGHISGWVASAA